MTLPVKAELRAALTGKPSTALDTRSAARLADFRKLC
jgi:hypothetical protein